MFFSILFMTAVIWDKKKYMVTGYLLNRKWCEVRLKTTLVSSNIDCHMADYSKVTCRWVSDDFYRFWWSLFGKLSSGSKNFLFICYKQFKNYESFKLNLSCKIIRENCMQYLRFRIILLIATNLKYCFWLVKYTLDAILKIKIRVT